MNSHMNIMHSSNANGTGRSIREPQPSMGYIHAYRGLSGSDERVSKLVSMVMASGDGSIDSMSAAVDSMYLDGTMSLDELNLVTSKIGSMSLVSTR